MEENLGEQQRPKIKHWINELNLEVFLSKVPQWFKYDFNLGEFGEYIKILNDCRSRIGRGTRNVNACVCVVRPNA